MQRWDPHRATSGWHPAVAEKPRAATARMVVITQPRLAPGFRLAGVRAVVAESAEAAAELLRELCADGETGVIAIHEPLLAGLPELLREHYEALAKPVVIALPTGEVIEEAQRRRARLAEMLHRAIGYRLTFRPEEPA